MVLHVIAIQDIKPHAFVSLLFNDSNRVLCRNSLPTEPPDAIAAHYIANGESVVFESGRDSEDLMRPRKEHYEQIARTGLR